VRRSGYSRDSALRSRDRGDRQPSAGEEGIRGAASVCAAHSASAHSAKHDNIFHGHVPGLSPAVYDFDLDRGEGGA